MGKIKWTYNIVKSEASKYKYKSEFMANNLGAYNAARRNNWLNDFNWEHHPKKWNYDSVKEESRKYKTRSNFSKGSAAAYNVARRNGWLDNFTWLIDSRINIFTDKIDSVYVYEFKDYNTAYVGRTLKRLQSQRDYQHIFSNDSVSSFAKSNDIPAPRMKILEENLTVKEGTLREGYWINKYKSDGWVLLNKAKPGGIGKLGKGKWNYKRTEEESRKYKTRKEFSKGSVGAYSAAYKNGWIDDFTWLINGNKLRAEQRRIWTIETTKKEAMKYKTKRDFEVGSPSAYTAARKNKWLEDYTWFENGFKKPRKWTYEALENEAKKYKSRKEFKEKNKKAYSVAVKNKWLKDYTWLETKLPKWNYETTKNEAMKYKSRWDFGKNSSWAYKVARDNNWLDEFFPKTK